MTCIEITELADPRLDGYRSLKHTNATRSSGTFVVEGDKLVDRLLSSRLQVESLLVGRRYLPRYRAAAVAAWPLYVVPDDWVEEVVGFNFHRGVLARAHQPALGGVADLPDCRTVLICPDVHDPENLGSLVRSSSALGVDALVVGRQSADPFSRRVVRVSMGAVFQLPIIVSRNLALDLQALRERGHQLWATVLDPEAEPLSGVDRPPQLTLLFGSEGHGLERQWIDLCDRRVTIAMRPGVDSLNVAVAAGIFLFELTRHSR